MTDRDALLLAVLRHPADDTARLIYADRLQESAELVPCPRCGGCGWSFGKAAPCPDCGGTCVVSDGLTERAAFIRAGVSGNATAATALWRTHGGRGLVGPLPTAPGVEWYYHLGEWDEIDTLAPVMCHALVTRGFVSAVRMPMGAFVGVAGSLFACQPVVGVGVTDKVPGGWRTNGLRTWMNGSTVAAGANSVHPDVFARLTGYVLPDWSGTAVRSYPTTAKALAALSRACLRHGRVAAGLAGATAR